MFHNLQASRIAASLAILAGCLLTVGCATQVNSNLGSSPEGTTKSSSAREPGIESAAVKHGAEIFKREMCVGCHANGENNLIPSKPIKGAEFKAEFSQDAKLEKTIRQGFPASGMPSFGPDRINAREMHDLILYIRSFTPMG